MKKCTSTHTYISQKIDFKFTILKIQNQRKIPFNSKKVTTDKCVHPTPEHSNIQTISIDPKIHFNKIIIEGLNLYFQQ